MNFQAPVQVVDDKAIEALLEMFDNVATLPISYIDGFALRKERFSLITRENGANYSFG